MSKTVFIDGGAGTTGLRLAERLGAREDIRLLEIEEALRKDERERARISNSADVVFLCLPDDAARQSVAGITNPSVLVIDASTAHRTQDDWAYGLPELSASHRRAVCCAKRVSVPGCHATGFSLLVHPLVDGGILPPETPVTCHSITGYSGAGKPMIAKYADPGRAACYGSPRQYALGQQHKHLPEMQKVTGLAQPPVFSPIICDFYAGMVVTVPLHTSLLEKYKGAREIHRFFTDRYAGQKLVTVMPFGAEQQYEGGMIDGEALAGKDTAQLFICGNEQRVVLVARIDNLGKGASGAAIQCMNLALGLDETTGLQV